MRSVDGRLHGFDAGNGKELWSVEQQVPRLSLRGTATPVIAKEVAVSGFDNGKVMAVSLTHRRHGVGHGACLAARPNGTRSAGRHRFGRERGRRQRVRHGLSGTHGHARARLGPDLVGARHVELSRPRRGRGELVRHGVRRHRGRAAPARRLGGLAQRQAEAPRTEHARRDQHGDRRGGLSRAICIGSTSRPANSWRASASPRIA